MPPRRARSAEFGDRTGDCQHRHLRTYPHFNKLADRGGGDSRPHVGRCELRKTKQITPVVASKLDRLSREGAATNVGRNGPANVE